MNDEAFVAVNSDKDGLQNDARMGKATHGRNFSVNLPYASKAGLHTNMSTLQVSKKPSQPSITATANANFGNS